MLVTVCFKCVFVNCLRTETFPDLHFQLFFCLDSSMATLWAVYESGYLRIGMSTNRDVDESGYLRIDMYPSKKMGAIGPLASAYLHRCFSKWTMNLVSRINKKGKNFASFN